MWQGSKVARARGRERKEEAEWEEWRLQLAFPKRRQGRRQSEQNCPQAAQQERELRRAKEKAEGGGETEGGE